MQNRKPMWRRYAGAGGLATGLLLLGGCVAVPPGYYAPGAPVVVAPPVSVGIGVGGYYGGGPAYYGRGYYGRPGYYGRGYYGGRGYWGPRY